MPVDLEQLDLSSITVAAKSADPKFFSSKLTGNGKAIGLLNQMLLPANTATNAKYKAHDYIEVKQHYTQADITTRMIPMAPLLRRALTPSVLGVGVTLAIPHVDDSFEVEALLGGKSDPQWEIRFDMTPQSAVLYEDCSGEKNQRDLVIQYRMELYFIDKTAPTAPTRAVIDPQVLPAGSAAVFVEWNSNPLTEAQYFIETHLGGRTFANTDALEEWMREYSIHERITRLALTWDEGAIADEVCNFIDDLPIAPSDSQLNLLAEQLRYLENYNVPLDAYRTIHKKIETVYAGAVANELAKQNLNLLMNHTLDHLDQMRAQLSTPSAPATAPALRPDLSKQQLAAVTTHEPLVMTQAGAGTGKSSVILQRIAYLEACGIPDSDITVLSFTNAAADNITAKNPNVGSMTIARMIHDIYSLNHPSHELSSIDTIVNSIDIFYPNSQFAAQFRQALLRVAKNETHAFTAMNTFIERNYDEVISLLSTIKQTSLELEIIICYQRIDSMIEPPHVQCKYLIIDEVQDNSIFEFIYVLKYITKHTQSLFIVGDASQTLYEFRSANPRALNTLEGSGVFATYKLTTNYRSNQEILDFANVVLNNLGTNQLANIQLRANALLVPTAGSFKEKVTVDYHRVQRISQFVAQELAATLRASVVPGYVQQCLDRGEQVAFLAHTRREVEVFKTVLEQKYPDKHVANLVSERVYSSDIFSQYIKHFWNDVLQVPPANASFVVSKGISDNLEKLARNAASAEKPILRMVSNWWIENSAAINAWVGLVGQGVLTEAMFMDRLRDNLLSYEIRNNAVRQSMTNQKNRERKQKNADMKAELVVSTIHGAKGMEFDNVVVLHKEDTTMSEEAKRMYYVAFTRAMKSEYILSYGTVVNAPIESNHLAIVTALEAREEAQAAAQVLRATGMSADDLVDDDDAASAAGDAADEPAALLEVS